MTKTLGTAPPREGVATLKQGFGPGPGLRAGDTRGLKGYAFFLAFGHPPAAQVNTPPKNIIEQRMLGGKRQ